MIDWPIIVTICVIVIPILLLLFSCLVTDGSVFSPVIDPNRWPPIDDEEFLRRCGPKVNREIALRVRRIVSEQLGVDYDRVYPEQNFVNDLGCD